MAFWNHIIDRRGIRLRRSNVPGEIPAGMRPGEIAVNIPDGKIFVANGTGTAHPAIAAGSGAASATTNASELTSGTLDDARLSANVVLTTDARLTDARSPLTHSHEITDVTGLQGALDGKVANAGNVAAIQRLTQAEYDAIATPDGSTLYVIVG